MVGMRALGEREYAQTLDETVVSGVCIMNNADLSRVRKRSSRKDVALTPLSTLGVIY